MNNNSNNNNVFFFLLLFMQCAMAALPPGFDEEIYCPEKMCLQKRSSIKQNIRRWRGITGPRAMFLECIDLVSKKTCRPRVWGVKLDQEYKDSLLRGKWHMENCTSSKERDEEANKLRRMDILNGYVQIGNRMDNIIETLAILSFI